MPGPMGAAVAPAPPAVPAATKPKRIDVLASKSTLIPLALQPSDSVQYFYDPVQLACVSTFKLQQARMTPAYMRKLVLIQNLVTGVYAAWSILLPQHGATLQRAMDMGILAAKQQAKKIQEHRKSGIMLSPKELEINFGSLAKYAKQLTGIPITEPESQVTRDSGYSSDTSEEEDKDDDDETESEESEDESAGDRMQPRLRSAESKASPEPAAAAASSHTAGLTPVKVDSSILVSPRQPGSPPKTSPSPRTSPTRKTSPPPNPQSPSPTRDADHDDDDNTPLGNLYLSPTSTTSPKLPLVAPQSLSPASDPSAALVEPPRSAVPVPVLASPAMSRSASQSSKQSVSSNKSTSSLRSGASAAKSSPQSTAPKIEASKRTSSLVRAPLKISTVTPEVVPEAPPKPSNSKSPLSPLLGPLAPLSPIDIANQATVVASTESSRTSLLPPLQITSLVSLLELDTWTVANDAIVNTDSLDVMPPLDIPSRTTSMSSTTLATASGPSAAEFSAASPTSPSISTSLNPKDIVAQLSEMPQDANLSNDLDTKSIRDQNVMQYFRRFQKDTPFLGGNSKFRARANKRRSRLGMVSSTDLSELGRSPSSSSSSKLSSRSMSVRSHSEQSSLSNRPFSPPLIERSVTMSSNFFDEKKQLVSSSIEKLKSKAKLFRSKSIKFMSSDEASRHTAPNGSVRLLGHHKNVSTSALPSSTQNSFDTGLGHPDADAYMMIPEIKKTHSESFVSDLFGELNGRFELPEDGVPGPSSGLGSSVPGGKTGAVAEPLVDLDSILDLSWKLDI
ncbi:uncharacterized protein BJ171DRAFT_237358 [Polychytrium aggregatum]|uniref:uncharacterized protein n=1 Tax=Polychytrium aggregatum TaxID=110093 RepID=UPI0022FEF832|nr:uncharacterized protein BJ171DRAFT_237358 [Polychytrium aggregatum]KAI9208266.1 hypothetical protein BJ171DRAFT_237358 [Polychytrium aggregatum]